ncbi:MAG: excalibur calcium-binding domain-containing protein [Pseudomonadota bacterium]|nr:excalibur calcium-binding domain-containing protein [Pseudomonadota bacterium]
MTRILSILLTLLPALALAHGGRTDANGCHTDRRTGTYHCHGSRTYSAPRQSGSSPLARGTLARASGSSSYYPNCASVRAAGIRTPINRSHPAYGAHLDRDGDGWACEPRPRRR